MSFVNLTAGGTQTSTGSTTANNARIPGIAGLGVLEMPDLDRMAGVMPDSNQVMQNPDMGQMVQNLMSDPQYMNQVTFNLIYIG